MSFNIYIVTWPNGFFGSGGQSWLSIDTKIIKESLEGIGCKVLVISIDKILDVNLDEDDIVIYCSADQPVLRAYIKDVIYMVNKKCTVIPSLDSLMAHENKGFQQIYRDKCGVGNLKGSYFVLPENNELEIPYVLKDVAGAGSSKVWLIQNKAQEKQKYKAFSSLPFSRYIKLLHRKLKLTRKQFDLYKYRHRKFTRLVSQEFIPDLKGDFKVLVFNEKYYVLKRYVRKNDFRASGSGNFIFEYPPEEVLNYARSVFERFDEPYISLDIAVSNNSAFLIEYQVLNFGPYALKSSEGFFKNDNGEWAFFKEDSDLNQVFSEALFCYVTNKRNYK